MKNFILTNFVKITCVFGLIALISTITIGLYTNESFVKSDDAYLMACFLACLNTIAALIYFLAKHLSSKHKNAVISIAAYFLVFGAFCLLIELTNSQITGLGYILLKGVAISLPILIIALRFSDRLAFRVLGLLSLLIYIAAFINMLIQRGL